MDLRAVQSSLKQIREAVDSVPDAVLKSMLPQQNSPSENGDNLSTLVTESRPSSNQSDSPELTSAVRINRFNFSFRVCSPVYLAPSVSELLLSKIGHILQNVQTEELRR